MSTTIRSDVSGATTTPVLVLGYAAERRSRNIIHDLVGGGHVVSIIVPDGRSGTLALFYTTEAAANAAVELHATPGMFELVSTDRPTIDMWYVLGDGAVTIELDDDTREVWVVSVSFQEVSPI